MKTFRDFLFDVHDVIDLQEGGLARQLSKAKTKTTGHIAADRGSDEGANRKKRKSLEKDLKKKGIGYKKTTGSYKYDDGSTGREVSYSTSKPSKMSKRRFGKTMRRLGRKHGQETVITKKPNKPAKLHDTQNKKPKRSFTLGKEKVGKHPQGAGQTGEKRVRGTKLPKSSNKDRNMHYNK
tara:strand:- start:323 stop:862 length:540 start_codon:yes stop_codon:yes gene_type:complete